MTAELTAAGHPGHCFPGLGHDFLLSELPEWWLHPAPLGAFSADERAWRLPQVQAVVSVEGACASSDAEEGRAEAGSAIPPHGTNWQMHMPGGMSSAGATRRRTRARTARILPGRRRPLGSAHGILRLDGKFRQFESTFPAASQSIYQSDIHERNAAGSPRSKRCVCFASTPAPEQNVSLQAKETTPESDSPPPRDARSTSDTCRDRDSDPESTAPRTSLS